MAKEKPRCWQGIADSSFPSIGDGQAGREESGCAGKGSRSGGTEASCCSRTENICSAEVGGCEACAWWQ